MRDGAVTAPDTLETPRLKLRRLVDGDAAALHDLSLEPAVRRYLWRDKVIPLAKAHAFIDESTSTFASHGFGIFAVATAEEPDLMIGFSGLQLFEDKTEAEVRFAVHPKHWGKGLASEAMLCVLRDVFQRDAVASVLATTDTPNQRSVKTLQRLGMSFERRARWHGLDTMFYSMCREDFEEFHDLGQ